MLFLLSACVSRQDVEGQLFFMDKIPSQICVDNPQLKRLGVTRKVSCKDFYNADECSNGELTYIVGVSYCSDRIQRFKAAEDHVIEAWLKKLGRPK